MGYSQRQFVFCLEGFFFFPLIVFKIFIFLFVPVFDDWQFHYSPLWDSMSLESKYSWWFWKILSKFLSIVPPSSPYYLLKKNPLLFVVRPSSYLVFWAKKGLLQGLTRRRAYALKNLQDPGSCSSPYCFSYDPHLSFSMVCFFFSVSPYCFHSCSPKVNKVNSWYASFHKCLQTHV